LSKPNESRALGVVLVVVQAALIAALVLTPGGDDWPVPSWVSAVASAAQIAGAAVLVVAAVNLGRSLTALPNPAERSTLKTGGLYRWVRHPIYSGLMALAIGTAVKSANVVDAVLAVALVVLLAGKARWEERLLSERYAGYATYAARTPAFIPGWLRGPPAGG
jgi:protein-S-isoprenylcysteine O-methyltransferase Ste14